MNFLFDNNLPPVWARALSELSSRQLASDVTQVVPLRDKFAANTDDTEWLAALGKEGGWTVLSGDFFRKHSRAEQDVIRRYGLSVFVLGKPWQSQEFWRRTAQLLLWWPRIVEQANNVSKASFEVPWRVNTRFLQIR